jgi:hypothetical protein
MTTPPFGRLSALDYAPHELPAAELGREPRRRANVEARLRGVCGRLPAEAFAALVDNIDATKRRWRRERL